MTLPVRRTVRGSLAALLVVFLATALGAATAEARPRHRNRGRSGCAASPACSGLSAAGRQAFATLMAAQVFATEAVGATETPAEVLALRALVEDPNALPAVEHLFRHATPAGKLYAIVAYWRVKPESYHARRESLIMTSGDTQVTTALGPNVHTTTIREVMSRHEGAHPFTPGMHRLDAFCPPLLRGDERPFGSDYAAGGATIQMLEGPRVMRAECEAWRQASQGGAQAP